MEIDIGRVQSAAPDAASLASARKLTSPAGWSGVGTDGGLVWGECQGSGSKPYLVACDLGDLGTKCTCPSRKFPCKHALGLLIGLGARSLRAGSPDRPVWVDEWLGRRRGAKAAADTAPKDAETEAKAVAQKAKNRAKREGNVLEGVETLERWLLDWCGRGLSSLVAAGPDEAATIVRRLVDAKAPGLAARLGLAFSDAALLPEPERAPHLVVELGVAAAICAAYRNRVRLAPALAAEIVEEAGVAVRREDLLADPTADRVSGQWFVAAASVETLSDGMQRSETWLVGFGGDALGRRALVLDFLPSAAGKLGNVRACGERIEGTLVFHPASLPLRAAAERLVTTGSLDPSPAVVSLPDALEAQARETATHPWKRSVPFLARDAVAWFHGSDLMLQADGVVVPASFAGAAESSAVLSGMPLGLCAGTLAGDEARIHWCSTPSGEWRAQ